MLSERINIQLFYDRMVKKEVANSFDTAKQVLVKTSVSFGN